MPCSWYIICWPVACSAFPVLISTNHANAARQMPRKLYIICQLIGNAYLWFVTSYVSYCISSKEWLSITALYRLRIVTCFFYFFSRPTGHYFSIFIRFLWSNVRYFHFVTMQDYPMSWYCWTPIMEILSTHHPSMGQCQRLTQWSYVFLAPTHRPVVIRVH